MADDVVRRMLRAALRAAEPAPNASSSLLSAGWTEIKSSSGPASEPGAEALEVVERIREPMYPHNSTFDESDPPLYSHSPEEAAAIVQEIIDARDKALKAYDIMLTTWIDSRSSHLKAEARAEAAQAKLKEALSFIEERNGDLSRADTALEAAEAKLREDAEALFSETGMSSILTAIMEIKIQREKASRLTVELAKATGALKWYADPYIYKPHPHGPAFDDRDLSFKAIATLAAIKEIEEG